VTQSFAERTRNITGEGLEDSALYIVRASMVMHRGNGQVSSMDKQQLFDFAKEWLATWTGNRPQELIEFYDDQATYYDPAHRDGLHGRDAILEYFTGLLEVYHDWVWEPLEVFPTEGGMTLKWKCAIPVAGEVICETGLDIVMLKGRKITRNEVYFDRTRLVAAVQAKKRQHRLIH
jgi:hypothetical protein